MKIEVLRLAIDFGLVILILLVQFVIYPSFKHIDKHHFIKWHQRYTNLIAVIAAPLMIMQVLVAYFFFDRFPDMFAPNLIYAVLVGLTWLLTFIIFVPLHAQLDRESNTPELCHRLTSRNVYRVVVWIGILLLDLYLMYL